MHIRDVSVLLCVPICIQNRIDFLVLISSCLSVWLQARTHQLLLQNRELLEHINQLVGRLQDLELKVNGVIPSADMLINIPPQVRYGLLSIFLPLPFSSFPFPLLSSRSPSFLDVALWLTPREGGEVGVSQAPRVGYEVQV